MNEITVNPQDIQDINAVDTAAPETNQQQVDQSTPPHLDEPSLSRSEMLREQRLDFAAGKQKKRAERQTQAQERGAQRRAALKEKFDRASNIFTTQVNVLKEKGRAAYDFAAEKGAAAYTKTTEAVGAVSQEISGSAPARALDRVLQVGVEGFMFAREQAARADEAIAQKLDTGMGNLVGKFEAGKLNFQAAKHERNQARLEAEQTKAAARLKDLEVQFKEHTRKIIDSARKEPETKRYFNLAKNLRNMAGESALPDSRDQLLGMADQLENLGNEAVKAAVAPQLENLRSETIDIYKQLKEDLDFYTEQVQALESRAAELRTEAQARLGNGQGLRTLRQGVVGMFTDARGTTQGAFRGLVNRAKARFS